MKPRIFLDANILVPYDLACLFLTLAEEDALELRWSSAVLSEAKRALTGKLGLPVDKVEKRFGMMTQAFQESLVVGYESREQHLQCDPKDRHVLAAAIESNSDFLITENIKDFDQLEMDKFNIELSRADSFLMTFSERHQSLVARAIASEVHHRASGQTVEAFLQSLHRFVPSFVDYWQGQRVELECLVGWYQKPSTAVTAVHAAEIVMSFLRKRAGEGLMLADGFEDITIFDGVLTASWNGDKTVNGPLLLELSPYDNLAELVAVPLSFNNEPGRQIRQHVNSINIIADFGVGNITSQETYSKATGVPLKWLPNTRGSNG